MTFLAPGALWFLAAVPAVAILALLLWRRRLEATASWASRTLWPSLLPGYRRGRLLASVALFSLALGCAVLGLARPGWGTVEETVERRGLDVVLVVDSSLSMTGVDVAPSRLEVAKALLRELVASLPGHRLALVQFEGEGQVLAPLTTDRRMVELLLESLEAGSLPTPGSLLGVGLTTGLRLLPAEEEGAGSPVLILVSDGEDHGDGRWSAALRPLQERGVVVHTVGVGTLEGSPLLEPDRAGLPFLLDRQGRKVISRLEPEVLETLARETGGTYHQVSSAHADLRPVREALLTAEGRLLEADTLTRTRERFQWLLGAAAAFLALHLAAGPFRSSAGGQP
jgi:Ca-activated chloride channel homolog